MLDKKEKAAIVKEFGKKPGDTGNTEVQIALLTARIKELTEHMKVHPKDKHTKRGLLKLVHTRRSFLNYLEKQDIEAFRALKNKLGIR